MTLDQLRYFMAAAKYEHVNRAAESIPISASVISQAIKVLEEELNCRLFTRENKRIRLSPDGIRLLEMADDLLGKADRIKQELAGTSPQLTGHYRIGGSHFLASKVLVPVMSELQKSNPRLTVDVSAQSTWSVIDSILAGRLDFGVGFSPLPHPQLEIEEIHKGNSLIAVRKNHPIFEKGEKTAFKRLSEYPATMHMATDKIFMVRHHPFLKDAHLDRNIRFSFDSDFVAVESLCCSDHWALLLDMVVAEFQRDLRVVEIPKNTGAHYTVHIIKHKSRKTDSAMSAAFELIKKQLAVLKTVE
ncbi:MAG: LysR family transcriptional regulator [Bdellovibrionales bacterium]